MFIGLIGLIEIVTRVNPRLPIPQFYRPQYSFIYLFNYKALDITNKQSQFTIYYLLQLGGVTALRVLELLLGFWSKI